MGYISGLTVNPLSSVLRNYLVTGYYPLTKHQLDFCVQTMRWEAIIKTLRYTAREKWTQTEQRPLTVTSLSCSSSLAFSSVNILSAALCSAFCSLWLWPWSSSKFWPVLFCCVATQSSRGEVLWGKKPQRVLIYHLPCQTVVLPGHTGHLIWQINKHNKHNKCTLEHKSMIPELWNPSTEDSIKGTEFSLSELLQTTTRLQGTDHGAAARDRLFGPAYAIGHRSSSSRQHAVCLMQQPARAARGPARQQRPHRTSALTPSAGL